MEHATGRLASVVNSRAALNGSAAFLTQILRVLFHGFKKARYFPSGEICAPAISGLPNSSSRSISGGNPCAGSETADASSDIARIIRVMAKIVACPPYARQPDPHSSGAHIVSLNGERHPFESIAHAAYRVACQAAMGPPCVGASGGGTVPPLPPAREGRLQSHAP